MLICTNTGKPTIIRGLTYQISGLDDGLDLEREGEAIFKGDFQVSQYHRLNKGDLKGKHVLGEKHNGSEHVELKCPLK